jgi:hypothetical protein
LEQKKATKKREGIEKARTGSAKTVLISYTDVRYPQPETGEQVPTVFFTIVLILCIRREKQLYRYRKTFTSTRLVNIEAKTCGIENEEKHQKFVIGIHKPTYSIWVPYGA